MSIPRRFAIEYPERALRLIEALEAQSGDLMGSFSLLAAGAVLTMPYERMKEQHFLNPIGGDADLAQAIHSLKQTPFISAPFWRRPIDPEAWRMTRIVSSLRAGERWQDETGRHPLAPKAPNTIGKKKAEGVLRVLRNALAHGNIIYLDQDGLEKPGATLRYLGFLSRYEESEMQRDESETYRLIAVAPHHFLDFVKDWATWVAGLSPEIKYMAA